MVTMPAIQKIPQEVNIHINLEYPPAETQVLQWKEHLTENEYREDELMSMVKNNPMHIAEIDYYAKQAYIQSAIEDRPGKVTVKDIHNVIERCCDKRSNPPLFGGTNNL